MKLKNLNKKKYHLFSDRLFIIGAVVSLLYLIVGYQFYKIQVIDHDAYDEELRATVQKEVDIPAIRGVIYDRYGKPLATNKTVYVVKVDPQVILKAGVLDQTLVKLADLLVKNNDTYIDVVPISAKVPFVYTEDEASVKRFITNYVPYNDNEHRNELWTYSAEELIEYLRGEDVFNIDPSISDEDTRKIIAMRLQMRASTYKKYLQVTLAQDISMETLVAIEENQSEYPSIFTEVESQRYYPYKEAFGNILGYTRTITQDQYQTLQEEGYEQDDIIGQVGIESTQESELRGKKGSKQIEVDNVGRTVHTNEVIEATSGNDIYLSIDADLQVAAYNALEQRLTDALVQRLKGGSSKMEPLTGHEILVSMAKNNQIDLQIMSAAPETSIQSQLYDRIVTSYQSELARLEQVEAKLPEEERTKLTLKQHFANMLDLETKPISDQELLLVMGEQKTLAFTEEQMTAIRAGNYNVENLLIGLFEKRLLKPDQMDITPCSGTAVVVDPNNGQTLALVSYPSYDNNMFIQDFNSIYRKLHDGVDTRNIEINRALKTAKAPGSTFKMVTAMAGLEEGVITKETKINDTGVYTKAGNPEPKCWIFTNSGHGHGPLDVQQALEVSCNYFFYDVGYRLGLKYGNPYGGIAILSEYVEKFGLGEKTGIELEEVSPNVSNPTTLVTNQAVRCLNNLRGLSGKNKQNLHDDLTEYLESGFYSLGNRNATTLEGQIDYLSRPYIKDMVDPELSIVLSEDLDIIYNKMLEDFSEELAVGTSVYAEQIAETVMSGDQNISLKTRTKDALSEFLKQLVQPGTHKTIQKTIDKIPDGVLQNIYLEAYKTTLKVNQNEADMQAVCETLKQRITALENGSFDYTVLMRDKIIDRIINVYLNNYFENVDLSWNVGVNVRTAIGQGDNGFTPVQIARYMAGLANGETVYNLTVINGIKDHKGTKQYEPHKAEPFGTINFNEEYLQTVYAGMHDVVYGSRGTARSYFANCEIPLAGKTGTAEGNEGESSWFVGFAPYNAPEISVVTSMYGTDGLGSNNILLARDIFELYYKVGQETEKVTLGNQFMP